MSMVDPPIPMVMAYPFSVICSVICSVSRGGSGWVLLLAAWATWSFDTWVHTAVMSRNAKQQDSRSMNGTTLMTASSAFFLPLPLPPSGTAAPAMGPPAVVGRLLGCCERAIPYRRREDSGTEPERFQRRHDRHPSVQSGRRSDDSLKNAG